MPDYLDHINLDIPVIRLLLFMTQEMLMIVVGAGSMCLCRVLGRGYLWYQRTFFSSFGEPVPWLPAVMYFLGGAIIFTVGMLKMFEV